VHFVRGYAMLATQKEVKSYLKEQQKDLFIDMLKVLLNRAM
jgi:hypothetical protein